MKITAIETYPVRIPLKPEFRMISSLGSHDTSDYVLIRVGTDAGIEGIGEATVAPRWSGETVGSVRSLVQHILEPALRGRDPRDIDSLAAVMDEVVVNNWFAKAAIEMACWDIAGKAAEQPVYEILGGPCRVRAIRSRFSLGAYEVERAERRAAELVEMGFSTIKVKVGRDADQDIERVKAVRRAIGTHRQLVIDANGGWDAATAISAVQALRSCNIALVEQPTPRRDFAALAEVRRHIEPPVMADDICFDLADAEQLIRDKCCQVISVYPGKNGGIARSRAIAELAARHDIACTIGSNLELDIATAAMGHLIVATPNLKVEQYPGDIYGPAYHERPIVRQPLELGGSIVTIPDAPGLGVELDWDAVRECAIVE